VIGAAPFIGTTPRGGRRTPESLNRRLVSSLDCALLAASLLLRALFNNYCQKRSFMFKKLLFGVLGFFLAAVAFAASVDANKADQAQLESVKGIGTKLSTRILDERKKGPYKDWNDLIERVEGVGGPSAARLSKEGLTVNGTSYEAPKAEKSAKTEKTK
jgi:competence protein ComEA